MSDRRPPQLGTLHRRVVSLLTALTFLVLATTGVIAFIGPFGIGIVGLHALMGFLFIALIALHILNNSRPLSSYLRSGALWGSLLATAAPNNIPKRGHIAPGQGHNFLRLVHITH
jgi:hypothetical protein